MDFYLYLNGVGRGPFSEERLRSFLADGLLRPDDLASTEPDAGWKPLSEFRRFELGGTPVETRPTLPPKIATPVPLPRPRAELPRAALPAVPTDALGPYARSTLAPNETAYFQTSLHWVIFLRFAGIAAAVFLLVAIPFAIAVQALTGLEFGWFALPLPAFILLPPTMAFASSEIVVTDRRVLIKTGIVRRQTMEMFVAKIESIAVDQGFLGRLFNYGSVTVRGTGGFEEVFTAIARPIAFRDCVQRLQSGEMPVPAAGV